MSLVRLMNSLVAHRRDYEMFLHEDFYDEVVAKWVTEGAIILDAGCGDGEMSVEMAESENGSEVIGMDLSANQLKKAKIRVRTTLINRNVHLVAGDLRALPFRSEIFDLVASRDVLEHVADPTGAVCSISRCLRTGGLFIATTSNCFNPLMLFAKFFPHNILYKVQRPGLPELDTYYKINTSKNAMTILSRNGLEIVVFAYHASFGFFYRLPNTLFSMYYFGFERLLLRISERFSSHLTFVTRKSHAEFCSNKVQHYDHL